MNAPSTSSTVVAVVLSVEKFPRLMELSEEERVAAKIRLDGTAFSDIGAGDWLGFYDWLRNSAGDTLGVRQYIDDRSSFPFEKTFAGVEADKTHGVVHIYFGHARNFDEAKSCDQSFGGNRLLAAENKIALTFYASNLKRIARLARSGITIKDRSREAAI